MRLAIILSSALLVAGPALCSSSMGVVCAPSSGGDEQGPERGRQLKWEQLPRMPGYSFVAQAPDIEAADDYQCEHENPVHTVEWWGTYNPLIEPPNDPPPHAFILKFYSDLPGPPFSQPGDVLYEERRYYPEHVVAWWDEDYRQWYYCLDIEDVPFYQQPDDIYWISIQAADVPAPHDWRWCECDPEDYWNDEAVYDHPMVAPRWTPFSHWFVVNEEPYHVELAFRLTMSGCVSVEEASWTSIKAMFR